MTLYNTTFAIDPELRDEFIAWLRDEFIPTATADGEYFESARLFTVDTLQPDSEALSLALQMETSEVDNINLWYADHGSRLFDHIMNRWPGRAVFFSTTLTGVE